MKNAKTKALLVCGALAVPLFLLEGAAHADYARSATRSARSRSAPTVGCRQQTSSPVS